MSVTMTPNFDLGHRHVSDCQPWKHVRGTYEAANCVVRHGDGARAGHGSHEEGDDEGSLHYECCWRIEW